MRKLNVISTSVIKTGTSASGKEWTLYEVTAVTESGAPIEEKLKSFDKLEGTVEVEVERNDDPKFGTSYMLKLPGGSAPPAGARLGPKVDELRDRVTAVEAQLAELRGLVNQLRGAAGLRDAPPAPTGAQF